MIRRRLKTSTYIDHHGWFRLLIDKTCLGIPNNNGFQNSGRAMATSNLTIHQDWQSAKGQNTDRQKHGGSVKFHFCTGVVVNIGIRVSLENVFELFRFLFFMNKNWRDVSILPLLGFPRARITIHQRGLATDHGTTLLVLAGIVLGSC
jgi:hypothetical protein